MSPVEKPPIFDLTRCPNPNCSPACGQCIGTRQAWQCTACGTHSRYVEGFPAPDWCSECDRRRQLTLFGEDDT
jgi:hypothetical protein